MHNGVRNTMSHAPSVWDFVQGLSPPPKLPQGQFPPMATPQAAPQSTHQAGPIPTAGQVINSEPFDVFSQDMNFPNLPGQAKHQPGKAAAFESRVPDLDAGMLSTLAPAQRSRLQSERDASLQMDQQLHQV